MRIERVPLSKINPAPYNPRKALKAGDREYDALRASLERWDLVEPLVWNQRTGNLVGGHQRLVILKERGATEVEVSVVDLSPEEEKLLNLALNKIQGDWDDGKLGEILREISEIGGNIEASGFSAPEVEELLARDEPSDLDDLLSVVDMERAVDRPLWIVVRAGAEVRGALEEAAALLERRGIRVERSYEREDR